MKLAPIAMAAALTVLAAWSAGAQRQRQRAPVDDAQFSAHNVPYDGRVTFVRLRYTPARTGYGTGGGFFGGINFQWDHDYPRADQHFTTIIGELTAIPRAGGTNIIAIGSPDLFRYPVAYMSEPGMWTMSDAEAANLRAYLLKGGFIIFDDFAGDYALANTEAMLRRVLPALRLERLELAHPLFHSFFEIPSLDFSHPYMGVPSAFLGVYDGADPAGRLLGVVNYNNDLGESWEWSDTGYLPIELTNEAYKLGINYLVYALTR